MRKINSYWFVVNVGRYWWKVDLVEVLSLSKDISRTQAKKLIDQGAMRVDITKNED